MDAPFDSPHLRFIEPLGRGGTADVAKAYASHLKRTVAVKYPLPSSKSQTIDFAGLARREWDLIGGARFPGLVRLWEAPSNSPDYLLLELCCGPTLDSLPGSDSPKTALSILSAVAVGLEFLNAAGLVHGDMKPQNVFLPRNWQSRLSGPLFYAKLSDFSLGRRLDEPESVRAGLGTVGYMAPETIADGITSHQSDLFALGVIAYQLLAGEHPFLKSDSDPVRVNSAVREADFIPLQQLQPDLPSGLVLLVMNLLALDPGARPKSAWEVCEELESAGSTYPFRKALRPAHLWLTGRSYPATVAASLDLSKPEAERLDSLTGHDPVTLRLVTTANFLHDRLAYEDGRFRFTEAVYWPGRIRNLALMQWLELPLGDKKASIRRAITTLAAPPGGDSADPVPAYDLLLPALLRIATVKRIATTLALQFRSRSEYEHAAGLFVLAGDLQSADQCADQASRSLQNENQNPRALRILNMVIDFARTGAREFDIRHLLLTKGEIQKQNGDIEEAMATYRLLVASYADRSPDKIMAEAYKDIGDLYKMKRDSAGGLRELRKAHDIFQALGDDLELSHTQNNIGNLLTMSDEIEAARREYRKALAIQRRINVPGDIASSLGNIAATYFMRGRYDRALRLFKIGLDIQNDVGNQVEIARTLNNIGATYAFADQPANAIQPLERSLEINRKIGNKYEILHNLDNLTNTMIQAGRLRECLTYLRDGMALVESQTNSPFLASFRYSTGMVYKQMGRVAESKESFEKAARLLKTLDDSQLALQTELQLTSIKYLIGYRDLALTETEQIAERGRELEDQHIELSALLLMSRIRPDDDFRKRAEQIIGKQNLVRDRRLLQVNRIEAFLDLDDITRAATEAESLQIRELADDEDIETARTANLLAEISLNARDSERATAYLAIAERAARSSGQAFEMVRATTLSARYELERGAFEACFARLKEGLQTAKKISENLPGDDDRRQFQQLRVIKYLGDRIREMKQRLGSRAAMDR